MTVSVKSKSCLDTLCSQSREFQALYKELPFFLHAFYHHHVQQDLTHAKKLYKEGLRRAEFTKGCFNMLISIYLQKYIFQ